jgi:hypothetical protein
MCGQCHQFFWHDNPGDAWEWFEKTYPERYTYLQEAKKNIVKRNDEYYQRVNKALDKKDMKSLYVLNYYKDNDNLLSNE